jgi:HD-GYP domain-containing protein (c-di-GMP phosphodiesterase class II)
MPQRGDSTELYHFIGQLNAVITNIRLYAPDHPQVERSLENAFATLAGLLRTQREVVVMRIGDDMMVNGQPLRDDRQDSWGMCRLLSDKDIGHMTFKQGVTEREFQLIVRNLVAGREGAVTGGDHIKIGRVELRVKREAAAELQAALEPVDETLAHMQETADGRLDEVKTIYHAVSRHKKIDIRGVDDMIGAFVQGFSSGVNPLGLMASLKSSDEYTFTHVVNVCILTMGQAESIGFKGSQLYSIGVASMLHDVGKLFIPDEIINKPGKLTDEERNVIETHTTQGARYLLKSDHIPKLAVLGAIEHHIKFDGTGYPSFHGGWKPNIVSQMIAISDVFDALRSRRVYSEPKPEEVVFNILQKEKGSSFNPLLVNNFMKVIGREVAKGGALGYKLGAGSSGPGTSTG